MHHLEQHQVESHTGNKVVLNLGWVSELLLNSQFDKTDPEY